MATSTEKFAKEHLKDCQILINNRVEKTIFPNVIFTWKINHYSKLQNNVFYYRAIQCFDTVWTFQLIITKGTLFIFFLTNIRIKWPIICVVCSNSKSPYLKFPEMISDGCYASKIFNETILDPANQYLKDDVITIQFTYNVGHSETMNHTYPYGHFNVPSVAHELCENFKTLYSNKLYSDIIILAWGIPFECHKLILRIRSEYFDEIFKKDEVACNIYINENPLIIEYMLMYIYSGELMDMSVFRLLEVFRLAHDFKIVSLKRKCAKILENSIEKDNVVQIFNAATENNVIHLKNAAAQFMACLPGNLFTKILKSTKQRVFFINKWNI